VLLRYHEWVGEKNEKVRSFDLTEVHGIIMIAVIDGNAEAAIGERLPNMKGDHTFGGDVGDVLGGSDVAYDENGKIVEGKNLLPVLRPVRRRLLRPKPAIASAAKSMPPLAGGDVPAAAAVKTAEEAPAPIAPPAVAIVEKSKDSLLTAVKGDAAPGPGPASKKGYTLQMKAFSSPDDAEKLADRLRRNGHDVRVEVGEANGRTWHRVRMGHFDNWDAAVSAKSSFEKNEQVIAYVITL
jgi:hypothetical protein